MSKKNGMKSLSNSKLIRAEPSSTLPVLKKSSQNILASEEMVKNKKEGMYKTKNIILLMNKN